MPIKVTCKCGKEYNLGDSAAGKTATCKSCGTKFKVPSADAPVQLKRSIDTHKQAVPTKSVAFWGKIVRWKSIKEVTRFALIEWIILGAIVVWGILGGMLTWWRVIEPESATAVLLFTIAGMEAALAYRLMSCSWKQLLIPAGYFFAVIVFSIFGGALFYLGAMFVVTLTTIWVVALELAKGRRRVKVLGILGAIAVASFLTCFGFDEPPVMWRTYLKLSHSSPHLTKEEQKRAEILNRAKNTVLSERSDAYGEAIISIRNVRLRNLAREFFKDYFNEAEKVDSCRIVVEMAKEDEFFKKLMRDDDIGGNNLIGATEGMRHYNRKIMEILKPLDENAAKSILKEYLTAWCFGKVKSLSGFDTTVPAEISYKPESFEIGLARKASDSEWEIKTVVQFKTKGGSIKAVPMQFSIMKTQGTIKLYSADIPE